MELDSRKKSRRDRMMRSKSFETQEVKEIGRKEAGESRSVPILWMGIKEDVFQTEGKECKTKKMCWKKSIPNEEDALAWDRQVCVGQWHWTRRVCDS